MQELQILQPSKTHHFDKGNVTIFKGIYNYSNSNIDFIALNLYLKNILISTIKISHMQVYMLIYGLSIGFLNKK